MTNFLQIFYNFLQSLQYNYNFYNFTTLFIRKSPGAIPKISLFQGKKGVGKQNFTPPPKKLYILLFFHQPGLLEFRIHSAN